jgi:hypothetical protein
LSASSGRSMVTTLRAQRGLPPGIPTRYRRRAPARSLSSEAQIVVTMNGCVIWPYRSGSVLVGVLAHVLGKEELARDATHCDEDPLVGDSAAARLMLHHPARAAAASSWGAGERAAHEAGGSQPRRPGAGSRPPRCSRLRESVRDRSRGRERRTPRSPLAFRHGDAPLDDRGSRKRRGRADPTAIASTVRRSRSRSRHRRRHSTGPAPTRAGSTRGFR